MNIWEFSMEKLAVMIGLGQLGRVFAGGLLKSGHVVAPVNRGDDLAAVAARWPEPDLVMISVAEADLHPVLSALPEPWRDNVCLLQNELLPRDWEAHGIENPTVISVWFEKKPGKDAHALLSSPVYGPHADSLIAALAAIDLPAHALSDADALLWELVRKNLYILTTNIAGLDAAGDVGALRDQHATLMTAVANDVLDVQDWLAGQQLPRAGLMNGLLEAIAADLRHGCAGRSAPSRLKRALHHADAAGLATPELHRIADAHGIV
jgi:ketopantoate reductase